MIPGSLEIAPNAPTQPTTRLPLTIIRIFLLCLIFFYDAILITYLDSFLSNMMASLDSVTPKTKVEKFASKVIYGFMFGRFVSAPLWGILIDKHGRKIILLAVLTVVSMLTLIFGFSTEYYDSLSIRILIGFFNGLLVIGKTLCTEICSNDLKAWSISFTNASWALGILLGPQIGYFFFEKFPSSPYSAPSVAVVVFGFLLIILSFVFFKETLPRRQDYQQLQGQENTATRAANQLNRIVNESDYAQLQTTLMIPNMAKLIVIYGINTLLAAGFDRTIFYWMNIRYDKGGLAFENEDIPRIYLYLTIIQTLAQSAIYPFIQKKRGDFWLLRNGHKLLMCAIISFPFVRVFFYQQNVFMRLKWILVWMLIRNTASSIILSAVQRFTNDPISTSKRGKINGFEVSFATGLSFANTAGGHVLHWSVIYRHIFPFNYCLVFLLMCGVISLALFVVDNLRFRDAERRRLRGELGVVA